MLKIALTEKSLSQEKKIFMCVKGKMYRMAHRTIYITKN